MRARQGAGLCSAKFQLKTHNKEAMPLLENLGSEIRNNSNMPFPNVPNKQFEGS